MKNIIKRLSQEDLKRLMGGTSKAETEDEECCPQTWPYGDTDSAAKPIKAGGLAGKARVKAKPNGKKPSPKGIKKNPCAK